MSWVRRCTPNLLQILETCFFTVPSLMMSRCAISRFVAPSTSRRITSRSRLVSGASGEYSVFCAGMGGKGTVLFGAGLASLRVLRALD